MGSLTKHKKTQHEDPIKERRKITTGTDGYSYLYCEICSSKIYTTGLGLKKHMTRHKSGKKPGRRDGWKKSEARPKRQTDDKYICCSCGKCFSHLPNLQAHLACHEKVKPYECEVCSRRFSFAMLLRNHYRVHTGERPYKCEVCPKGFAQQTQLKAHIRTHTGEKPYRCQYCGKGFALNNNLKVHVRMHTGENPYKCPLCSATFRSASTRKRHCKSAHGIVLDLKDVVNSNVDVKNTESVESIMHLIRGDVSKEIISLSSAVVEQKEEGISCDEDDLQLPICFVRTRNLLSHIKTVHETRREELPTKEEVVDDDKIYECGVCGKIFKTDIRYRLHMKRHDPERREDDAKPAVPLYHCDVCNKGFSSSYRLKGHKQIHGEKTFVCSECGKAFYKKGTFDKHQKMHRDNKVYKCENCPKVFTHMSALSFHRVTHTGYKSHRCKICSKMFTQSAGLRSHLRIHTGETPYHCKVCPKRFKQQSQLMYHKRIHSGEKPYKCPYCGKAFALNGNLTVHIRTHTGETPYVCPVCTKGFYDASSRKKHCMSQHGISLKTGGEFPTGKDAGSDGNSAAYYVEEINQENSRSSMTYLVQRSQDDDDEDVGAASDEFNNRTAYIIQETGDEDSQDSMAYLIEPSSGNSLPFITEGVENDPKFSIESTNVRSILKSKSSSIFF